MSPYRHRWATAVAILIALLLLTTACSHSSVKTQPPRPSSSTVANATSTSTVDPRAQPAVVAYENFSSRAKTALRKPFGPNDPTPPNANFSDYAFDPFLAQYQSYVWGLKHDGVEFRGTPPKHHIGLVSLHLSASPWPTVILSDCETEGASWRAYDVKSDVALPQSTPSIPPPYPSTVTVILYENRWGVEKIKVDASRTCSA